MRKTQSTKTRVATPSATTRGAKSPARKTPDKKNASEKKKSTKSTTKSTNRASSRATSSSKKKGESTPISKRTRNQSKRDLQPDQNAVGPGRTPTPAKSSTKRPKTPTSSTKKAKSPRSKTKVVKTPKKSPKNSKTPTKRLFKTKLRATSDSDDDNSDESDESTTRTGNRTLFCEIGTCGKECYCFCDVCERVLCHEHKDNCGCNANEDHSDSSITDAASDNEGDNSDERSEYESASTDGEATAAPPDSASAINPTLIAILQNVVEVQNKAAEAQAKTAEHQESQLAARKRLLETEDTRREAQVALQTQTMLANRKVAYDREAKQVRQVNLIKSNGVQVLKLLQSASKLIVAEIIRLNSSPAKDQTQRFQSAIELIRDKLKGGGNVIRNQADELLRKNNPVANEEDWIDLCRQIIIRMGSNNNVNELKYTIIDIAQIQPMIPRFNQPPMALDEYLVTVTDTIDIVKWTADLIKVEISPVEYERINRAHLEALPMNIIQLCSPDGNTATIKEYADKWNNQLTSIKATADYIWKLPYGKQSGQTVQTQRHIVQRQRRPMQRGIVANISTNQLLGFEPDEPMTETQEPPTDNRQRRSGHSDNRHYVNNPPRNDNRSTQKPSPRSESRDDDRSRDRDRDRGQGRDRDRNRDNDREQPRETSERSGRDSRREHSSTNSQRQHNSSDNRQSSANGGRPPPYRQSQGKTYNRPPNGGARPSMCTKHGCNASHKWYSCPHIKCMKCKGLGHVARNCQQAGAAPSQHTHNFGNMQQSPFFPLMTPPPGPPPAAAPINAVLQQLQAAQQPPAATDTTDGNRLNV